MRNHNKMPRKKFVAKLDEVHHLPDEELIRRRQTWQPRIQITLTHQDQRIINQLDQELKRRGLVPPVLSNVIPGRHKARVEVE